MGSYKGGNPKQYDVLTVKPKFQILTMKHVLKLLPLLLFTGCQTSTKVTVVRESIVPYALVVNGQTNVFYGTNKNNGSLDRLSSGQTVQFSGLEFNTNGTFKVGGYANDGGAATMAELFKGLAALMEKLAEGSAKGLKGGL